MLFVYILRKLLKTEKERSRYKMALTPENIRRMKELIEEKKSGGNKDAMKQRPDKVQGQARRSIKNKKTGGVFDK